MKRVAVWVFFLIGFVVSATAKDCIVIFNGTLGVGTFSAGEHSGGSAFFGGSLSADWMPAVEMGLSYGIETGLLGGKAENTVILGIPAIFRFGWHPDFIEIAGADIFILAKIGWAFGMWDSKLEKESVPNGAVGGINFCGRYFLTPLIGLYAEFGYSYYGLARSSNYPEYPLGYGSGKFYTSLGLSLLFNTMETKKE